MIINPVTVKFSKHEAEAIRKLLEAKCKRTRNPGVLDYALGRIETALAELPSKGKEPAQ